MTTMQHLRDQIAVEVRWRREDAGWTQAQLGEKVGMFQSRIAEIERGKRSLTLRTVLRLATVFGAELHLHFLPPIIKGGRDEG